MADQTWRVLIVDDEPPIRAELNYLLKQDGRVGRIEEAGGATEAVEKILAFGPEVLFLDIQMPGTSGVLNYLLKQDGRVGRIEEAGGATEAVEKILAFGPEVLFLDIQMPGTSGVQLADTLQKLKKPPVIVFVTAFSEYAAEAFELDAADYVLKPVEQDRLEKALDKVENALNARKPTIAEPVRRIQGERNGKRTYIPVTDIAYIEARADYASAHTEAGTYLVNESISVLERRLTNEGFLRVHRSFLVNIDDVRDVEVLKPSGLMQLKLGRTDASIPVSRRRATGVKKQLGLA